MCTHVWFAPQELPTNPQASCGSAAQHGTVPIRNVTHYQSEAQHITNQKGHALTKEAQQMNQNSCYTSIQKRSALPIEPTFMLCLHSEAQRAVNCHYHSCHAEGASMEKACHLYQQSCHAKGQKRCSYQLTPPCIPVPMLVLNIQRSCGGHMHHHNVKICMICVTNYLFDGYVPKRNPQQLKTSSIVKHQDPRQTTPNRLSALPCISIHKTHQSSNYLNCMGLIKTHGD